MVASYIRLPVAQRGLRACRGFTLIELVISIVLLGLLAAVGTTMISDSFDTSRLINTSESSNSEARYVLERMEREIREVQYTGGAYTISTMTGAKMVFTKGNGITVTLNYSGSSLTLGYSLPATTSTLTSKVNSFAFTYYQANGTTPATSGSNIHFVEISLTLTDSSGRKIAQRTRIALRNAG